MINVFQPSLGKEEAAAVAKVLESNWLGKGKLTDQFEENFAKHLGVGKNHVCSDNCCTEGLFLSMELFDIGVGDEVILPTCSFVGAANAIQKCGAEIAFCDVDKQTQNATAADIEKKITSKTKAVLLMHYGGVPCEMDEIMQMADAHHIKVIEDAACGVASKYKGRALGTIGDMGMWSFDAMKILVCGDGSIIYVKDEELLQRASKLLYFGLESKSGYSNSVDQKWWEFEISCLGRRSIMNDITAAMALEQLKKLPGFIKRRKEIAEMYTSGLQNLEWLTVPKPVPADCESSYYFYHIQLKNGKRDELARFLRDRGIYTTFRYFPLHRVKYYRCHERFENADWVADNTLCLPIHQSLTDKEIGFIIDKIVEFGENQ